MVSAPALLLFPDIDPEAAKWSSIFKYIIASSGTLSCSKNGLRFVVF